VIEFVGIPLVSG